MVEDVEKIKKEMVEAKMKGDRAEYVRLKERLLEIQRKRGLW